MRPGRRPHDRQACFHARLREAVAEAGGPRHVARLTGISEAQLYRYFKGMAVPSDRIVVLAETCIVSIGWLFGEVEQVRRSPHVRQ